MIYLDNCSTTHKKPMCVKLAALKALNSYSINPSRAGYNLATKVSEEIFKTRELFASNLNTKPENIIFTSGCTMALNTAIFGSAKKNGHIILSIYEHNSVLRAVEHLKSTHNVSYTLIKPNKQGFINSGDIAKAIKSNTYMVIINHTSNVTGITQNIEKIGKVCKSNNLLFLVDCAQSFGHEKIDMQKFNIDMLAIAGHKGVYATTGIGVLATNNVTLSPLIYGGTGTFSDKIKQPTDTPDGFESGTQNILGILTLQAGLKYVIKNQDKINNKIYNLTKYFLERLNRIKNVNCFSSNPNSGVVSFTINQKDSSLVSTLLDDKFKIATRSGLHCAPLVHKHFGTLKNGMTRISISYFNSMKDIKKCLKAIEKIALDLLM